MKVLVLGHRGMLGHIVARYLAEKNVDVLTTNARYTGAPDDALIAATKESRADWIINCIGKIKQKTGDPTDLFLGNSQLPIHIKSFLSRGQSLLHPSTDCVFSGERGNYHADEPRDANDYYGLSKILGEAAAEPGRCQVIRTSIIGPELPESPKAGLMAWFLSQTGSVNGFTNHLWNGITTLQWSKLAFEIITGAIKPSQSILQVGAADRVTKHELLNLISETWPHKIEIRPTTAKDRVDRTLHPHLELPPIKTQLTDLSNWYR